MLSTLRNAWKVPELRKRLIYTLLMLAIFRIGNFIPVPGVNTEALTRAVSQQGSILGFYDMMNGGAFSKCSVFAMGVLPYINASIIMQLLTVAIPSLESLSKEGEEGRKKIQKYTRYGSIIIGVLQSFGTYAIMTQLNAIPDTSAFNIFVIMITLTTASTFLMWLGDQITVKGVGNGISLIIFWGILSRIPSMIMSVAKLQQTEEVNVIQVAILIVMIVALLVAVVISTLAERRIPVQYAGKAAGGKMFKGQSTHIPINLTASEVIAIIFAMSVMQFPITIAQFWPNSGFSKVINGAYSPFKWGSWQYGLLFFILVLFFTWFYTQVTFKPDEMSENMHKSSGFIPGIRPGEPTTSYIERVLTRISILGGAFAGVISIFPMILESTGAFKGVSLSGTALLIAVGVAIEFVKQLKSQLVMRHYEGFLK
jgi:preprotein translocase subunit SecY